MFWLYLKLGFQHIVNISAYDHILFVTMLTAIYQLRQWKNILALVTAFTLGHSVSLALATLRIVMVPSALIEWFIVVTIFLTGVENLFIRVEKDYRAFTTKYWIKYGIAMFFGLIHGLGFSTYLQSMLGEESSLALPLFSFNVGVELGQWLVVSVVLLITFLLVEIIHLKRRTWNLLLSGVGIGISLFLIFKRFPW